MSTRLTEIFRRWNSRFPSAGHLALASLAIGVATGIVLTAGYDVGAARRSLALLSLSSPAGRFVRALHAWSGHVLLVLAFFHVAEHILVRSERRARFAAWARMVAIVPLLLGLMLSGFVLRGDAEGELARQVVTGLLSLLPFGERIAALLTGSGTDLQLPYLHHAATLTVLVVLLAIEHARRFWPSARALAGALAAIACGALLVPPGLHDGVDGIVKGPWSFISAQELLHWLSRPAWIWLLASLPIAALLALPYLEGSPRRASLSALGAMVLFYTATGLFAQVFRGPGWELRRPALTEFRPSITGVAARVDERNATLTSGSVEGCIACHGEVTGMEPAHDPRTVGCFACHLGNPFAPDAAGAHRGMIRVPGNLETARLTCGQSNCHGEIVERVRGSLMATVRGMVAVDRWAFGESETPDSTATAAQLGSSPADTHLSQLCVDCHLGTVKEKPGRLSQTSRGGGCLACHLTENKRRDYAAEKAARFTHPKLSLKATDEHCFGCHSRSARISLSYEGWWEGSLTEEAARGLPPGAYRKLEDGRVLSRMTPDVHHAKGMACIDCHTASEVMGDGKAHLHEEQATRVRCSTCHRSRPAKTVTTASLDAATLAAVKAHLGETPPARLLVEDESGEVLTNAWEGEKGTITMRGKIDGKIRTATPPAAACSALEGHRRLSCQTCHTPWVTTCTSCHTQWDRGARKKSEPWVEYDGIPRLDAPALGLLSRGGEARIEPVVPGMIMTLNLPHTPAPDPLPESAETLRGPHSKFLRAWAFAVPHTTVKASRSCASCHSSSFALGYGRGSLDLVRAGESWEWRFSPEFASLPQDGLPADAWIPFLKPGGGVATRLELSPLDLETQRRTLAVGACLPCHDPASASGRQIFANFKQSLERMGPRCRLPR